MKKKSIDKPDITIKKIEDNNEITYLEMRKVVKGARTSGYLMLPKLLIGEYVKIIYEKENGEVIEKK